ncbi:MAG: degU 2 [Fibrobacteria bacterium]|jgi:DNA-binding NarL/FixJ family response regulator|nr:degU 2 [Fibrobacteria bacterium]
MSKPSVAPALPTFRRAIQVMIAEDHMVVRQGLKALLESEGDIKVVGEAENGRLAVELAHKLRPEVIIMDIAMPQLNGLEATRQILKAYPQTRIILLSAYKDDAYIEKATALGAVGYLIKQTSLDALAKVIREVHRGRVFFSPEVAKHLVHPGQRLPIREDLIKKKVAHLTSREAEVLQLIAEGQSNKQAGGSLGISIKTVEKHRQHLMEKLAIHDTAGLTRYAISAGIIESSVQLTIV